MREIKFRVWSKTDKRFLRLADDDDNYTLAYSSNSWECYSGFENRSKIVLQQYTGLKDKNSKEIYEGDILNNIGVIEWISEKDGYDWNGWRGSKQNHGDNIAQGSIIGNIFENPELLDN